MAINFATVYFETANHQRGSPCSVGVVVVEDGKIVRNYSQLMRPPEAADSFDSFNIRIHGIRPQDVENSPRFAETLPNILERIGSLPVLAHNAAFDIGVIRNACDLSEIAWPQIQYGCTWMLAKRVLDLGSYSLPYCAMELGISLPNHHDALADALAAAEVAIALAGRTQTESIDDLLSHCNVKWGRLEAGLWSGSRATPQFRNYVHNEPPTINYDADQDGAFFQKHVSITGILPEGVTRNQAIYGLAMQGGVHHDTPRIDTDILVVGDIDPRKLAPGAAMSSKSKKALAMRNKGSKIELMSGVDFLALLDG